MPPVPPYPSYKPSGIEWLGEIPEHWEIIKPKLIVGNALDAVQTGPFGSQLHASDYVDEGVPLILIGNVGDRKFNIEGLPRVLEKDAIRLTRYRVNEGDIVFTRVGSIGRLALVTANEAGWLISGQMLRLRLISRLMDNNYCVYAFGDRSVLRFIDLRQIGSTRDSINTEILRNIPIPKPPLDEQRAIADFLDRETARIDAFIEKKQRLIELLKEKRTALITHAVTMGLDPAVPMKDSGIEWLGEVVPEHWEVTQLRRAILKFVDYRGKTPKKVDSGIPLITAGAIKNGSIYFNKAEAYIDEADYDSWMVRGLPRRGDVLVTTEAPLGETAQIQDENIALAQRIILLKTKKDMLLNAYLKYYWLSQAGQGELGSQATGSTALGIKASKFKGCTILIPALSEQRAIAAFLDRETERIDALVAKVEETIATLKEYRTALVTAAVTGKIDVRRDVSA